MLIRSATTNTPLLLGTLVCALAVTNATRIGSPDHAIVNALENLQGNATQGPCCDAPSNIFDCCDAQWADLDTDGSRLAVYQVSAREERSGCRPSSQGRMKLTCPTGLTLLSPAIEAGAPHQDCELIGTTQAECTLLRDHPLRVGCYGDTDQDVLLEASVDSFLQGICNDTLNILSLWPLVATYGGESSYGISMASQCEPATSDDANQPVASFDCNGDIFGMGSSRTCGMGASCSVAYACTLTYVWGFGTIPICSGNDICNGTYSPVSMTVAETPCPTKDFTKNSVLTGGTCNVNANCASGICVNGKCKDATLAANQTCQEDADCTLGACGKETFDPTENQVCCFTGERVHYPSHGLEYCTGQAANASCGLNTMCLSQICSFGACRATHIPDREPCEEGWDCASGSCAIYFSDESWGCCPEGGTAAREVDDVTSIYCTDLPTGTSCVQDTDCDSNICVFGVCHEERLADTEPCQKNNHCASRICGLEEAKDGSPAVCCPNGDAKVYDVSWTYTDYWICTNLTAGQACIDDFQCSSGTCLENVCGQARQADLEPCDSNNDCKSGRCGLAEAKETAPSICCPNGDSKVYYVSWMYTDYWICTNLTAGQACVDDYQCSSGTCLESICGQYRQADLEPCDSNNDCQSGVCAIAEAKETAPSICCPSGNSKVYDVSWTYTDYWICTNLTAGQACVDDHQCSSGTCLKSICGQARQTDLESCDSHGDCDSGMCALAEAAENAISICCVDGLARSYGNKWICSHLTAGQGCESDLDCSSGVCELKICQEARKADKEKCESNSHCISGLCGLAESSETAPSVCCPDGDGKIHDVPWDYSDKWICGHLAVGQQCESDLDCTSGVCFQKVCGEGRKADLEECDSNNDCSSGRCGLAEYSESSPTICCKGGQALYVDVEWEYSDHWICSETPTGGGCASDSQCETGVCVQKSCLASRQEGLAPCDSNFDCQSNACAKNELQEAAPRVCCPGGQMELLDVAWSFSDEYFCADSDPLTASRQAGEACADSSDCQASITCAYDSYSEQANLICCDSYYTLDVSWHYRDKIFCGDRPLGTACNDDRVCGSGLCNGSVCATARLPDGEACTRANECEKRACAYNSYSEFADTTCCEGGEYYLLDVEWTYKDIWFCGELPTGTACGDDRMCASSLCINGVCSETRVEDRGACMKANECENRSCAYGSYSEFADTICCEGGSAYLLDVEWTYKDFWFCGQLPLNITCGDDRMCDSGLCIGGVCSEKRLEDGESCTRGNECTNRACAYNSYSEFADAICCEGGKNYLLDVDWTYRDFRFCGELPIRTACGDDRMCASGLCIDGVCSDKRLKDGEGCTKGNDCENRACAYSSYSEFADTMCCEGGESYLLDVEWTYKDFRFCGELPTGTACGDDRMCASGLCIGGVCSDKRLQDGEACTKGNECENRACAYSSYSEFADTMCCEEGVAYSLDVPWTYRDYYFCGQLSLNTSCGDDRMCESSICLNNKCAADRLGDGKECTKHSDCENAACALEEFGEYAGKQCCKEGEMMELDVTWTYRDYFFCGNIGTGQVCSVDHQCESKECVGTGETTGVCS